VLFCFSNLITYDLYSVIVYLKITSPKQFRSLIELTKNLIRISYINYLKNFRFFILYFVMKKTRFYLVKLPFRSITIFLFCFVFGCNSKPVNSNLLREILQESKEPIIKKVLSDLDSHEVQILFTRIHRDSLGLPKFERHTFQENAKQYFYPASTVKLPVAILALQKIRKLQSQGIPITPETPFMVFSSKNVIVKSDTTHPKNNLTIAHLIKKIFLVSDNSAYNYLFDFIGKDFANNAIHKIGITNFNLSHKFSDAENKNSTPRFIFFNQNGDTIYNQAPMISNQKIKNTHLDEVLKGKGYVKEGAVIEEPMDFSEKNYVSIVDCSFLLKSFGKIIRSRI